MKRLPRLLVVTSLALALEAACSDRSPTAPRSVSEKAQASASAPTAGLSRRPVTRVIGARGSIISLPAGVWGGDQAELVVTPAGASVRFFCAHGNVTASLGSDETGRFDLIGTLVREGGPTPIDDTPFRVPARYIGWTDGRTMILSVSVEGLPPLGPFRLTLGKPSRLGRCPIL